LITLRSASVDAIARPRRDERQAWLSTTDDGLLHAARRRPRDGKVEFDRRDGRP